MNSAKYDKQVFELAESFLYSLNTKDKQPVTKKMVSKYFQAEKRLSKLSQIYCRLLNSAQNANMKAGVIGGSIDGIENLRVILCDFKPNAILKKYGNNSKIVFSDVQKYVKPRGKVNPDGLWAKYCNTIISGAKFIDKFNSAEDFYKWVDWFYKDDRARPALPLLLQNKVDGFGLALACDFLKELGYSKYAKPDVYLKKIFTSLELCSANATDYEVLEAIIRVAQHVGVTPYKVDKVFWLIGSGNFYKDKKKSRRNADKFIEFVQSQLVC